MRFADFLRATIGIFLAAALALVAATTLGTKSGSSDAPLYVAGGWWLVSIAIGLWMGRRSGVSEAIGRLLASARHQNSLPEMNPSRTLINRLWPLLVPAVGGIVLASTSPQVPGIAAGFAIIWALSWRHQAAAVTAIEERDGARFYVDNTPPYGAIKLVRTPGFKANLIEQQNAAPVGRS